jgi:hypothetical protein
VDEAQRLPRLYAAGVITHSELTYRLVQMAAERPPQEIGPLLPEWCLRELREASASPPSRHEDCPRAFAIVCVAGPPSPEGETRRDPRQGQRSWYDGIWRWHYYLWGK